MYCKQQGWYQTISDTTLTVPDICCSAVTKVCTGGEQLLASYNCTTYNDPSGRTNTVDKGFNDTNMAIHACPIKQSICGST